MKEVVRGKVAKVSGVVGGLAGALTGVAVNAQMAFAEAVVTEAQITAIETDIMANLGVILPAGLTVLGVMIGISLIPRIIYKFF